MCIMDIIIELIFVRKSTKKIVQHAKKKWIANTNTKLENMNINALMHADITLHIQIHVY